jgi:glycosidase
MSVLDGSVEKAKVASSLLLTSPGTPFIYYGEEIGMQGRKPDEDIRLPMQWSQEANAGFTTGDPWRDPDPAFEQVNVAGEAGDPDSLLSHYRDLIALRAAHPALRSDGIWLVETDTPALFASLRVENGDMILVLLNLEAANHFHPEMTVSLPRHVASQYLMPGGPRLQVDEAGGFKSSTLVPAFAPYSIHILQLGK